jgi:hypothetical protein
MDLAIVLSIIASIVTILAFLYMVIFGGRGLVDWLGRRRQATSAASTEGTVPDKPVSKQRTEIQRPVQPSTSINANGAPPQESDATTWLSQHGLRENPFAESNAAVEADLDSYFVDVGGIIDEIVDSKMPCILFAGRGCGKTAYRRMLEAYCRPFDRNSQQLVIVYSASSFFQVLAAANGNPDQVNAGQHIGELLRRGLDALNMAARQDIEIEEALSQHSVAAKLAAYQDRYALRRMRSPEGRSDVDSGQIYTLESLHDLVELAWACGCQSFLVLVDGVDELPQVSGNLDAQVALLEPLLGTLPLIEQSGLIFKFFLPQELKATLPQYSWFRRDRVSPLYNIVWTNDTLRNLISSRLTFFSTAGGQSYTGLGQLCEDDLATQVDDELVQLAEGRPRWAINLADMLLKKHCKQQDPPARIQLKTWNSVKNEWLGRRLELVLPEPIPEEEASHEQLVKLRHVITDRFSAEELRTLCFDLDVDFDDLRGEGKMTKVRELITYLERRHRIADLVKTGKQIRPDIPWDSIVEMN